MRLHQLTENKDYNLAKKLWDQLSGDAQYAFRTWETSNWEDGDLDRAFRENSELAHHIMDISQPIRDQIKRKHGETMTLYRGLNGRRGIKDGRKLFSWTSSEKMARIFSGSREKNYRPVTDQEIKAALERYERTGFTTFRNKKYIKNKEMPQYYNIYDRHNNNITDGDDLEEEFRDYQERINDYIEREQNRDGEVISKAIPVDDIVWVMMGGNANEYVVKGHAE